MFFRLAICVSFLLLGACTEKSGGDLLPDGGAAPPRPHQYLRASPYSRLVLEIDSVPGSEPRTDAQSEVVAALAAVVSKRGGVVATRDDALASRGSEHAWSFEELDAMAKSAFDLTVSDDTVRIHVMFVDGHSNEDTQNGRVLGLAWQNRHIVIFKRSLTQSCGGLIGSDTLCARAERAVWIHELGHVLGLVDNGLPMVNPHKDTARGAHDVSQDCVMYFAYEGEALMDVLRDQLLAGGSANPGFDSACQADMAAVRDAP